MTVHEDRAGAKLGCGSQGHSGMHTKFTRFIRCSRDYSTLVALASDYYCLPFQRRIVKLFHRDEEGIHVDVEDGFGGGKHCGHANCRRKAIERTARNRVEFWSSRGTPPARVALSLSRVSPARHYNEACKNGFRRVPHGRSPLPEPLVP